MVTDRWGAFRKASSMRRPVVASAVLVAGMCLSVLPTAASGAVLFRETFDGPDLPGSLTYTPGIPWSIDSGRLFCDYLGTNSTELAQTNDGFTAPAGYPLIYSLDVGIPVGADEGSYSVGLIFGGYRAVFHPGYAPLPGAFRMEGGFTAGNMSMGFTPKKGVLHHVEVETQSLVSSLAVNVTITGLGTDDAIHEFNYSFIDTSPDLGSGTFGGLRNGGGNSLSDAFYDNFQAKVVPEPSTLIIWSLLTVLTVTVGWWRGARRAA